MISRRAGLTLWIVVAATGCPVAPKSPPPAPETEEPTVVRVPIDPEESPLSFRWLSHDAVLVEPSTGQRTLAEFGNYVGRSARTLASARLSVWDDEEAWKRSLAKTPGEDVLGHKRAQFLKESRGAPVEEYTVFDASGEVVYERDFRDYPLADTDGP